LFSYYFRSFFFLFGVSTKYWSENQKGRDHMWVLSVGTKIILKLILRNGGMICGLDSFDLGCGACLPLVNTVKKFRIP
jgi:hypothetical protein